MADSKEIILAKRAGYKDCFEEIAADALHNGKMVKMGRHGIDHWVAEKYPLPKVLVPRVEAIKDQDGRRIEFSMQSECPGGSRKLAWRPRPDVAWGFDTFERFQYTAYQGHPDHPNLLRLWAELIERPDIEVDESDYSNKPAYLSDLAETGLELHGLKP